MINEVVRFEPRSKNVQNVGSALRRVDVQEDSDQEQERNV
jgi:hypothetical protein